MTTLAEATLNVGRNLKDYHQGISSSTGTTTTLIDSALDAQDGFFDGGTIWFLTGTLAGKSAVVSSWNLADHTLTFETQTAAAASGIGYAVLPGAYPKGTLVAAVNRALQELGPFITHDTSLTVDEDVDQYTLPTGVSGVLRVEEATATSAPYGYDRNFYWREAAGVLYFTPNYAPANDGNIIRLWYMAAHAELSTDAGVVNSAVHLDLLTWTALSFIYLWQLQRVWNDDPLVKEMLNNAKQEAAISRNRHPIMTMQRDPTMGAY